MDIYFADRYYGFDDALYAGARLLEIIASSQNRLSDWLRDVPERPASPELRVACPDAKKTEVVARCAATYHSRGCSIVDIDGARVSFDGGWALVRASNTQPSLVLRVEADSDERLQAITDDLHAVVRAALDEVNR